jgi:hypothetical protein
MKRKPTPVEQPVVVSKEIMDQARRAVSQDLPRRASKCTVCGSDSAANSQEALCWVCRRLKISAWRDADVQMGAQE